ncbi:hypothetical protein H6P81_004722 [Aristolochia fimbriata]|uniref:Uncharacterized protein n=1 Tax=Aristolochia fimbriata TaxID=158543 RepID=A0AAV7EWZ0_ARIFI|nr:hypothetical protein H6P81_004722 [Aristolochia fimbriata]
MGPPSSVVCDLVVVSMITLLILFSIFSVAFILHFHQKTRKYHLLRDFNSLWPVRLLLVVSALLFSVSELLRLTRFRRGNPNRFPILPVLSVFHRVGLCKIYIVASQGLFQPAFFITLLFLLNASLRKPDYEEHTLLRALTLLLFSCLPLFLLQTLFVFFSERVLLWLGGQGMLVDFLRRHSHAALAAGEGEGQPRDHYVLCAYPIFSTLLLALFGALYVVCFVVVCWRTVELVINRALRFRVYGLAFAVLSAIPAQAACLLLSVFWDPNEVIFNLLSTVAFVSVLICALVGEGILVIRPIVDSLAVGG